MFVPIFDYTKTTNMRPNSVTNTWQHVYPLLYGTIFPEVKDVSLKKFLFALVYLGIVYLVLYCQFIEGASVD